MSDLRQSSAYAHHLQILGWHIEQHPQTKQFAYIKKLPILPVSIIKVQRIKANQLDFSWLKHLRQKYHSIKCYIEPEIDTFGKKELQAHHYKSSKHPMLPTKTLQLNLKLSEKQLKTNMKTKTRYNIGRAEAFGLEISCQTGNELLKNQELLTNSKNLLKQNARRIKLPFSTKAFESYLKSFADKSYLVTATSHDQNKLLACCLILCTKDHAYYSHNASNQEGRKFFAPTLCLWEAIREAKKRKLSTFDFDGLYDKRFPKKRWKGFSRFKKGFGGKELAYPPAYVKLGWWS